MAHVITHDEVYEVINGELDFQDDMAKQDDSHVVADIPLGSILLAIEENLHLARKAWYSGQEPHEDAMHYVRKIAALGVRAGMQQGMPRREGY